jgi:hypothetical protein
VKVHAILVRSCLVFLAFSLGIHNAWTAPAYMNDTDSRQPATSLSFLSIDKPKFPRVILSETQSLAGNIQRYTKYSIVTGGGEVINKIANLQSLNPDVMYFRELMVPEYLGFHFPSVHCAQGHGIPFENTAPSTENCNVYAGHWLYQPGTTTKQSIDNTTTSVQVSDASRYAVGQYAVVYNAPAGSFINAEHVKITGRNTSNNTLVLQRGFKSSAVSHAVGSIVAQHVTGQAGDTKNWSFNLSTKCPKDSNGKNYSDVAVKFIRNNYNKDWQANTSTAIVSGFIFDSDFYFILSSKNADADNDLQLDNGVSSSGVNWWGAGLEAFYQGVRNAFPNKYISTGHQLSRGFAAVNGAQMEGWPQSNNFHSVNPEYKTINSCLSDYRYYSHFIEKGPVASHVLTKTPTMTYPNGTNASSNRPFRFALGMGLLEDGYFGSQNSAEDPDPWYDEFAVITDPDAPNYGEAVMSNPSDETAIRENSGWMGSPIGGFERIYDEAAFLPSSSLVTPGVFDNDIYGWTGVNVNVSKSTSSVMDGAGSLFASNPTSYQAALYGAKIKGPVAILTKNAWYTLAFSARSDSPREIKANVGGFGERFLVGKTWRRYIMAFQAPASGNQRITFSIGRESTQFFLDSVYLFQGNPNVFRRDFEHGIVVVNATDQSKYVDLGETFQRISGFQDPDINNGERLKSLTIEPWDAAILVRLPNSPPTPVPVDPLPSINVCGKSTFSASTDKGAFIWKDCNAGTWRYRVSPGGDSGGVDYSGSVTSDAGFTIVNPYSLESHDSLITSSSRIDYLMRTWNSSIDGMNFAIPDGSSACFSLDTPLDAKIYLGRDKVEMPSSFDLSTLQQCY